MRIATVSQALLPFGSPADSFVQDLGLYRACGSLYTVLEREKRRRLFWSLYALESSIAADVGRFVSLLEEEIDQNYPQDVQLASLTEGSSMDQAITISDKSLVHLLID